jgi:hypothetical protein
MMGNGLRKATLLIDQRCGVSQISTCAEWVSGPFVKRHHHGGRAVALEQAAWCLKMPTLLFEPIN